MKLPSIQSISIAACFCVFIAMGLATAHAEQGRAWHIAVDGDANAAGTAEDPWSIEVLADAAAPVEPGDTVYLHEGTYRHPDRSIQSEGFAVRLAGATDRPVHVRPRPGERVTIDGGLRVLEPADHLWIWELELIVSENFTEPRRIEEPGSHPQSLARPWGGLHVFAGSHCKFINLVIHHNAQGVSWWRGSTDSELYGCIIYDNGWDAPDRGHGHAIYTQNQTGTKRIVDNIMTGGFGQTMHAYGSERAYVDHFHIAGNIAYDANRFLVGGGRPSRDIHVADNLLHRVPTQLGFNAPHNEDATIIGNTIVRAGLTVIRFQEVTQQDNRLIDPDDEDAALPATIVELRPNRYDGDRAHLAIWNFTDADHTAVDLSEWLEPGDRYRLMDPTDFFGEPIASDTYNGDDANIPTPGEFSVYVVLREQR